MDPLTIMALVSAGASIFGDILGSSAQEEAIEKRAEEERMASDKRQIDADKQMERLVSLQKVKTATSGFKYTGSFANLTLSSFQDFAEDRQAELLNVHLKENNLDQMKDNVIAGGYMKAFTDAGKGFFNYYMMKNPKYDNASELSGYRFKNEDLFA